MAEWINRDQYFERYGGFAKDPYEKGSIQGPEIIKTVVMETNNALIESIWEAPLEYQDL